MGPRAVVSIHARALAAPLAADAVAFGGDFNNGRGGGALTWKGKDDNPIPWRFTAGIHTTSLAASSSSSSSELLPVRPELLPATSDDANGLVRGMSPAQRTAMLSALLRAEHGDESVVLTRGGSARRLSAGQMEALFAAADADGSGRVDRAEFDKFLRSRFFLDLQPGHPMPLLDHVDDHQIDELHNNGASTSATPVSRDVLMAVFMAQAIPFVGFGFMDNMIMIAAVLYF